MTVRRRHKKLVARINEYVGRRNERITEDVAWDMFRGECAERAEAIFLARVGAVKVSTPLGATSVAVCAAVSEQAAA